MNQLHLTDSYKPSLSVVIFRKSLTVIFENIVFRTILSKVSGQSCPPPGQSCPKIFYLGFIKEKAHRMSLS